MVVVDNNSTDHTATVVDSVAKQGLSLHRVVESRVGFPYVYNQGLLQAKKADWVCFIDDDCVADREWYAQLVAGIKRHPDAAAVMGSSQTVHDQSLWSLATWSFDQIWKLTGVAGISRTLVDKKVNDLEVLDNKNIAYNQHFLRAHNIRFNENAVVTDGVGAAEDADLGMQISSYGGEAWFLPKAQVKHHDPTSFRWFCRKIISSARAVRLYRDRWLSRRNTQTSVRQPKQNLRLLRQWLETSTQHQLSPLKRIGLLLVLVCGACLFRCVYVVTRLKKAKF